MRKVDDTKGVIRIRRSKKDRQYKGQKKNDKRTNNNLQNTTQKTKDWSTRTPQKTGDGLRCCGWISSSCPASDPVVSDCCLMPNEQLFSNIMVRSYIWWDDDVHFVQGQHA
jgi:hypothetical protein